MKTVNIYVCMEIVQYHVDSFACDDFFDDILLTEYPQFKQLYRIGILHSSYINISILVVYKTVELLTMCNTQFILLTILATIMVYSTIV